MMTRMSKTLSGTPEWAVRLLRAEGVNPARVVAVDYYDQNDRHGTQRSRGVTAHVLADPDHPSAGTFTVSASERWYVGDTP